MKRLLISLGAAALGIASLLAGLGVDAWLHAADPTLAEREGIFTLGNPGHALLGVGVLLACGGVLSAVHAAWGLAGPRGWLGRPYARWSFTCASAVASVGAVVFALSVSAGGHEHAHAETAQAHADSAGTGAAHVAGAPAGAAAADAPSEHTSGSDAPASRHGHTPVAATPAEISCGNDLVRRTQEATARFTDINVALADGYRTNAAQPNPTHYANPAYRRDGKIMDLAHPESLVYVTNRATGTKVLIGALFVMPKGEAGPQPCGPVTSWHTHASCRNASTGDIITVESGATCPAGDRYAESAEMMHVWFVPGRPNGVAPRAVSPG